MPRDKVYHLIAGWLLGMTAFYNPYAGVFFVVLGAAGKEAFDQIRYNRGQHPVGWDWLDFIATITGGVITIGVVYVL
jgi:uncharacterized membrane protein